MLVAEVLSPAYNTINVRDEKYNFMKLFGKHLIWFDLSDTDNDKLVGFLRHFAAHPKSGFLTEAEKTRRKEPKRHDKTDDSNRSK